MFKTLLIHELQKYLYSLRFQISFIIVVLVFAFGTVSYIVSISKTQDNYTKLMQEQYKELESRVANITDVAVYFNYFIISPKIYAVIDDCKETVLPNRISYNAYNVYGFDARTNSNNPLLKKAQGLNWFFIMSMVLSFITFLFSFDAISGEKEDRTLSLVFSNKVSRSSYILSKFLSIVSIIFVITIFGIILSLLIITLSGKISINSGFLSETAGFLLISLLFISVMAIIGLLASTLSKQSNISLLTCLTVWIFIAVILPNSSLFFANKIFAIPSALEVENIVKHEYDNIIKNAPPGSQNRNDSNPFLPQHELRANLHMEVMESKKRHKDTYYNQMFRQFENTRMLSIFSPIAQFESLNEGILGGGYLRFRKNWNDMHVFQEQFLSWFKNIDTKDDKSPHWHNPYEELSTSRLPVGIEQIPIYIEKKASLAERIAYMQTYLIAMILIFGIIFSICFVRFIKYDVR